MKNKGHSLDENISFIYNDENVVFSMEWGSLGVMYLNLLGEYTRDNKIDQYNKLKKQKQFYFPPTNLGHDSYPYGRVKALALNDIYGKDFDLLAYADMMYWIENYNKNMLNG